MIEDHKRKGFLFPPIIKRMKLDERHMSPFMQERFIEDNKKPHGETVVQVKKQRYFKSNGIFRRITVKEFSS